MTTSSRFCWYELRTTDTASAQAFYTDVVGLQVRDAEGAAAFCLADRPVATLMKLSERAAAQGAPAHWLGHLGVDDVDAAAQRVIALGGAQLGPAQRTADGTPLVLLRDPGGAVLALRPRMDEASNAVIWHELHTVDRERVWPMYAELCGWHVTDSLDLGSEAGTYQIFGWDEGDLGAGAMMNSARSPGIHPHWLFYFRVEDLDAAVAKVRTREGKVMFGPMPIPGGGRIAMCEDPQGAAFAMLEPMPG
ncbi:VOC family protein [Chondromyces apiculatus]|uniref:VOC domain-containing protein n=1 Tax=Chondromyces apiculatus DSM 436 TaxID=1192034 RepID=A0A017T9U2_9BACT|nr:VOC family protein [Chondromyces apiculatus]EYF05565.1 Hypothetical protein CAP_3113 [Chondromyces apiculatus DSM 436]